MQWVLGLRKATDKFKDECGGKISFQKVDCAGNFFRLKLFPSIFLLAK